MSGLTPRNSLGGKAGEGGGIGKGRGGWSLVPGRMEGSGVRLYLHRLRMSYVKVLVCSLLRSVLGVLGH